MNIMNLLGQFKSVLQNPSAFLQQKGLPANAFQNPQAAVQQMVTSGRMSQEQFNQLRQMAQQIQSNPAFAQMFGK